MKKFLFSLCLLALSFTASAQVQQFKFGYFSYKQALESMPEYTTTQRNMSDLKAKYDAETKRTEEEFNKKYEEFLDGQHDFAPSIRNKRQAELTELMEKNIAFKEEARRLLKQAENDAYAPLKSRLANVVNTIGINRGLAFILNTDNDATPYVDSTMGEDVSTIVKDALAK